jgi:50S ribosomal protein L16 3-hydroxylase
MTLPNPLSRLGSMTVAEFMETYWQRKPVLLRGVLPADFCPLSLDSLKSLACSDEADSRLIITEEWPPEIYHGPFEAEELEDVPDKEWTLLVQEVDRLLPEAAQVLDCFRFIPNWRVDDLMVSFAAPGGGVGAHTDKYDVFLIQGLGNRRWEIDPRPNTNPTWRPDSDVAVLDGFEAKESWELSPGDVLYLPPHVAHNGIALTDCMTLSVGFRAPAAAELLENMLGYLGDETAARYLEADPSASAAPGAIAEQTLANLRAAVRGLLQDDGALDEWLGRSLTEPVRGRVGDANGVLEALPETGTVRPASASQAAHVDTAQGVTLFASGQAFHLPPSDRDAVAALTGTSGLNLEAPLTPSLREVLTALLAQGIVRVL